MKERIHINRTDQCEHYEIVHQGWLEKLSKKNSKVCWVKLKWRKRWFVLRRSGEIPGQHFLTYYTDINCRKIKGQIDVGRINQCNQINAESKFEDVKSKYHYKFDIKTPKKTYYLAAESEEDMNKWIDFVCHVCDLKTITVEEISDFERSSENMCRQFSSSTEEHSSPNSPNTFTNGSSNHYISFSECISGKLSLSIFPPSPLVESYNTPRTSRPLPSLSKHLVSPLPSLGSESVFTDEESINDSLKSPPLINWETFPCLPQNSPHIPIAVPPPRPPKPSHLTENTTQLLNGSKSNNHRTNSALNKSSENVFIYKIDEMDITKVDRSKSATLKYSSSIDSLRKIVNESLISENQIQTPPAINRKIKPNIDNAQNVVNRAILTPTTLLPNSQPAIPPRNNHNDKLRIIKDQITKPSVISNIQRRHSASSDNIDENEVFSKQINKKSSNLENHSLTRSEAKCSNNIQYLDLEIEHHKRHDYNILESSCSSYGEIDRKKTQALINALLRNGLGGQQPRPRHN